MTCPRCAELAAEIEMLLRALRGIAMPHDLCFTEKVGVARGAIERSLDVSAILAAHDAEVRAEVWKGLKNFLDEQTGTFDGFKWDDGGGSCGFDTAMGRVGDFVKAREAEEKANG